MVVLTLTRHYRDGPYEFYHRQSARSAPGHSPRLIEPEVVREACVALGLTYRKRILDPLTTSQVLLVQAFHGNTRAF